MNFFKNSILILGITSILSFACCLAIYIYGWGSLVYPIEFVIKPRPTWGYPEAKDHYNTRELTGTKTFVSRYTTRGTLTKTKKAKHIILSGDSNTFGLELKENETLAHQLQTSIGNKKYNIITLAYPGWGPAHILERLKSLEVQDFIKEEEGFLFYNFLDFHLERVCGSRPYFSWSRGLTPNYQLIGPDKLQYIGLHESDINFHKTLLNNGLGKIKLFLQGQAGKKYFPPYFGIPLNKRENCFKKFSLVLRELRDTYKAKFPNGKFVITNLPIDIYYNREYTKNLYPKLFNPKEIKFLDFAKRFEKSKEELNFTRKDVFQEDGHINSYGFQILANFFKEEIE